MKKVLIGAIVTALVLVSHKVHAALNTSLGTVVVTASRIEQEGHRVAGNLSVITNEQIQESNAQSVPELLQQVEGVFVSDNSTVKSSVVDIRGFGDSASRNTLVLVDGRRLNVIDSGKADLVQLSLDSVERIEVIRGGSSVLYGDNAVGGVINIITKKGEEGFRGKVGAQTDSFGSRGQHVEISGKEGKFAYYAFGKYLDKRGYRRNADELYKDFNGRIDFDATDKISFGVQYGYHEDSYELPGDLTVSELATLGRRGSADIGNFAETQDQYVRLTMDVDPLPDDIYLGHILFDVTLRDREGFSNFAGFETNRDIYSKGVTGKYVFDQEILDRKVDFVVGVDFYENSNDILGSGTNTSDLTISRDDLAFYTNLQFETIDNLYAIGGVRYNRSNYEFDQRSGTVNFEKRKPRETVSSGGLKYEYAEGSNVHVNFQQTFRFLTTDEWYSLFPPDVGFNSDLRQQTGEQYEIGIKHNFDNKAIVSVTPYWMKTNDELYFNIATFENLNYDSINRFGVEFGSRFDILEFLDDIEFFDKIEFFANYTYQDPEFSDGDNNGKQVPFVPNHQFNTGFVTQFLDHYNVSVISRYVGTRYPINDLGNNAAKINAHIVTDLNLAYEADHFEVFMKVNNLFDQKYDTFESTNSSLTSRNVYPAPEKSFLWGVNVKF